MVLAMAQQISRALGRVCKLGKRVVAGGHESRRPDQRAMGTTATAFTAREAAHGPALLHRRVLNGMLWVLIAYRRPMA